MSRATLLRLGILLLLLLAIIACLYFLPVRAWLTEFQEWTASLGIWGLVLIAVVYVPACVLFIPGSILTFGAGLTYGVIPATIAVSLGSTTGAALAFLLGRTIARKWIEEKISRYPRFRALDQAIGVEGFKIVLLLRLSPAFPFNLLNYALGLTSVPFRTYLLASWIGMLPGTLLYVYLGSVARQAVELTDQTKPRDPVADAIFWGGLAVTVVVTVAITRIAKKALDRITEPRPPGSEGLSHPDGRGCEPAP